MVDPSNTPELSPVILRFLAALRRRIRWYVWLEGLAWTVAWTGIAFWASWGIDWFFEPSAVVRGFVLGIALLVIGAVFFRYVLRRVFVRLSDRNMAVLLERRFGEFEDSLLTAVELGGADPRADSPDPEMLAHTCRQAADRIHLAKLPEVFNPVPLRKSIASAILLAAGVVTFALLAGEPFDTWVQRSLLFSDKLYQRRTELLVEGFEDGVVKVVRGGDVEVIALANTSKPLVPESVTIRYRTDEGARDKKKMDRVGTPGQYQEYSFKFEDVLVSHTFDLIGGDDRIEGLRIEVVDSPAIRRMKLRCDYPEYMSRRSKDVNVTGMMRVPRGTRVTVLGESNKDLVAAEVDMVRLAASKKEEDQKTHQRLKLEGRSFEYPVGWFLRDHELTVSLEDTDGITSREPVRLVMTVLEDLAPQVAIELNGIGQEITPQASLPFAGEVTDDYGITAVWIDHGVDTAEAEAFPLEFPSDRTDKPSYPPIRKIKRALDVQPLDLAAGQTLNVSVKARDRYALSRDKIPQLSRDEIPHVSSSQTWTLKVVTPQRLRTILRRDELRLREHFEAIIRQTEETRDLVALTRFGEEPGTSPGSGGSEPGEDGSEPGDADPEPGETPGGVGNKSGEGEADDTEAPLKAAEQRKFRVQTARENSYKSAQEIQGVAAGFDQICAKLDNNRIEDREALKIRLSGEIAVPLRQIADTMFAELENRLHRLEDVAADIQQGPEARQAAIDQIDHILAQMQEVLDRMEDMEDFNELIEILQAIIEAQKDVGQRTKEESKAELKGLTDDD